MKNFNTMTNKLEIAKELLANTKNINLKNFIEKYINNLNEIQNKYDIIYCIAGLGGSIDHELTNINLLDKYSNLIFISQKEKIFKIESNYKFNNMINTKISFIIFSDKVKGLTLKGFKYNIENLDIKKGEARCISNVIVENEANLLIKSGSLLCVIK